jgi:hypothetical protein
VIGGPLTHPGVPPVTGMVTGRLEAGPRQIRYPPGHPPTGARRAAGRPGGARDGS